jgi:diguanylate cyclase (GGDEF)-like protein
MKVGATDYLLKPFDRATLRPALEGILQRTRLRQERDRLLAENIEFLGERALFERALALFRATTLEALSEKVLEGLCRETGCAGRGALVARRGRRRRAPAPAARTGSVRLEEERERISGEASCRRPCARSARRRRWSTGASRTATRPALVVALRRNDELAGLVRLTDKLGGERFDDVDRATAEKLLSFADAAYRNAERFARLERRTLQDPDTGAYRIEYLHDVVRNEIEKANRFGRTFSVLKVGVEPLAPLRKRSDDQAFRNWHGSLARYLARLLRATDLIAVEGDGQFCVLLAETGAVGAAAFKERTRQALAGSEALGAVKPGLRPEVILGSVSYPGDATQLEALLRVLDRRTAEDRRARERERRLAALPIGDALTRPDRERRGRARAVGRVAVPVRDLRGRPPAARAQRDVLPARRAVRGGAGRGPAPAPRCAVRDRPGRARGPALDRARRRRRHLAARGCSGGPAVRGALRRRAVVRADRGPGRGAGSGGAGSLERPLARRVARVPAAAGAPRAEARLDGGGRADRGRGRGPRALGREGVPRASASTCAWRATAPPRSRSRSRTSPPRWSCRRRCR